MKYYYQSMGFIVGKQEDAALMLADLIIRLLRVKDIKEFPRRFGLHK